MNFSKLEVDTAMVMLKPEIPIATKNSVARINRNCGIVGKPRKRKHVSSRGDM